MFGSQRINMNAKFRRRQSHIFFLLLLVSKASTNNAQESNNNFCGTSWDDASSNCKDRQHCPSGTDDECETEGHICYGGTLCDSTKGDGSKFAFADVPYNDISNTRFCGNSWDSALEGCSVETHCPSGYNDECPGDLSCYGGLGCNVKDLLEEEAEKAAEEEAMGGAGASAERIGKDDPRRNQFCGSSWSDASQSCSTWCPDADDSGCPAGQTCFGDTSCYYSEDIVPTQTPTLIPTDLPTTRAPSEYKDPANNRFCGKTWGLAVAECSIESSCKSGLDDECPEGQTCHGGTTCNLIDLLTKAEVPDGPTLKPTMPPRNDLSNNQFCGENWDLADASCSLATHCPDGNCPDGQTCYGGTSCNAFDMTHQPTQLPSESPTPGPTAKPTGPTQSPSLNPTLNPTDKPTGPSKSPSYPPTISRKPTEQPVVFIPEDDMRHSFWCGKNWNDVVTNCPQPCTSGEDTECPKGQTCFAFTTCRPSPKPTSSLNNDLSANENSTETSDVADAIDTPSEPINGTDAVDDGSFSPISSPIDEDGDENSTIGTTIDETVVGALEDYSSLDNNNTGTNFSNTTTLSPNVDAGMEGKTDPTDIPPVAAAETIDSPLHNDTQHPSAAPVMDQMPSTLSSGSINWTEAETNSPSVWQDVNTDLPSPPPSIPELSEASSAPTTAMPSDRPVEETKSYSISPPSPALVSGIGAILKASSRGITSDILLYTDPKTGSAKPTTMYQYDGFLNALSIFSKSLVGSSYFYFGDEAASSVNYGLVNVALFLSNAAIETVRFDICDDISWEKDVFGLYPLSNACGQGGFTGHSSVSYENSYACKEEEKHMSCEVDSNMESVAATNGAWTGAPPPLECFPKVSNRLVTGSWNPSLSCKEDNCDMYDGHVQGNIDPMSAPASNSFGRTDVQGCCWWGRGPFPRGSSGTCKIGKLNYFLGQSSSNARYDVDFCKTPEAVCNGNFGDDVTSAEVRWIMGLLYWIDEVQSYNKDGWSYIDKIHVFVDGALSDDTIFDAIATIVSRGCHDCGRPTSITERKAKFDKIVSIFGRAQAGVTPAPSIAQVETDTPTLSSSKNVTPLPTIVTDSQVSNAPETYNFSPLSSPPTMSEITTLPSSEPSFQPTQASVPESNTDLTYAPTTSTNALSSEDLANRYEFANSYCASSLEDARVKCSTATIKTCNDDDPPCIIGTACFGNVVCPMLGGANAAQISTQHSNTFPSVDTTEQSQNPSQPPSISAPLVLSPLSCGLICLRPLIEEECLGVGNSILVLSDCISVGVGQVCQSLGECGTKALIHNCRGHSVFIRVLPDQCSQISTDDVSMDTAHAPSLQPSRSVSLNDVLTHQTSQYSQPDYENIENAWWRDVPLNSSTPNHPTVASGLSFAAALIFSYHVAL